MSTEPVPRDVIRSDGHQRPQCPSCSAGRMHPIRIDVHLGGYHGFDYGVSWILACRPPDATESGWSPDETGPNGLSVCGLVVPMTPVKAENYLTEM